MNKTVVLTALQQYDSILPQPKQHHTLKKVVLILSHILAFALGNWWGFAEGVIWKTAQGG